MISLLKEQIVVMGWSKPLLAQAVMLNIYEQYTGTRF